MIAWGFLEVLMFTGFALKTSGIKFPGVLADSIHGLSVTLSLLGIAVIQVS
jgi:hypothetical protein